MNHIHTTVSDYYRIHNTITDCDYNYSLESTLHNTPAQTQ